jgi:uncharacterized RDD family membrane protein YckC
MKVTLFVRRILAFIFDFLCIGILGVGFLMLFHSADATENIVLDNPFFAAIFFGVWFSLFLIRDLKDAQSPGKRIFNLKVLSDRFKPAENHLLIIRNAGLFFWPVDILFLVGKKRKTLFDYLTKTTVAISSEVPINILQLTIWGSALILMIISLWLIDILKGPTFWH